MQTPAETIEGVVEARNDKGVRVNGDWYNVSKFRPVELPLVGDHVRVAFDTKGFLQDVEILDAAMPLPARDERLRTRLSVLRSAAIFVASRPDLRSAEVLRLAESWLAWADDDDEES